MPEVVDLGTIDELIASVSYGDPNHPEFKVVFYTAFQVNLALEARGCVERCIVSVVPPRQISAYIGSCCIWDSELREFGSVPTWQEAINLYAAALKAEAVLLEGDPLDEDFDEDDDEDSEEDEEEEDE